MNSQTMTQKTNVEEIRKELRTLASIDTGLLGQYARRALKDRMALLAMKIQEANQ